MEKQEGRNEDENVHVQQTRQRVPVDDVFVAGLEEQNEGHREGEQDDEETDGEKDSHDAADPRLLAADRDEDVDGAPSGEAAAVAVAGRAVGVVVRVQGRRRGGGAGGDVGCGRGRPGAGRARGARLDDDPQIPRGDGGDALERFLDVRAGVAHEGFLKGQDEQRLHEVRAVVAVVLGAAAVAADDPREERRLVLELPLDKDGILADGVVLEVDDDVDVVGVERVVEGNRVGHVGVRREIGGLVDVAGFHTARRETGFDRFPCDVGELGRD